LLAVVIICFEGVFHGCSSFACSLNVWKLARFSLASRVSSPGKIVKKLLLSLPSFLFAFRFRSI